jgi:hypothetical protein
MRFIRPLIALVLALAPGPALNAGAQDPQMQHRGQMVMGFDQTTTTHHFSLYDDGGAIAVVNGATDVTNRDAIRLHLPTSRDVRGWLQAPMGCPPGRCRRHVRSGQAERSARVQLRRDAA